MLERLHIILGGCVGKDTKTVNYYCYYYYSKDYSENVTINCCTDTLQKMAMQCGQRTIINWMQTAHCTPRRCTDSVVVGWALGLLKASALGDYEYQSPPVASNHNTGGVRWHHKTLINAQPSTIIKCVQREKNPSSEPQRSLRLGLTSVFFYLNKLEYCVCWFSVSYSERGKGYDSLDAYFSFRAWQRQRHITLIQHHNKPHTAAAVALLCHRQSGHTACRP